MRSELPAPATISLRSDSRMRWERISLRSSGSGYSPTERPRFEILYAPRSFIAGQHTRKRGWGSSSSGELLDQVVERGELLRRSAEELDADAGLAVALERREHAARPRHASDRLEGLAAGELELEQDAPAGRERLGRAHEGASAGDVRAGLLRRAEEGPTRP